MSVVEEEQVEVVEAPVPEQAVIFMARRRELRLTMIPRQPQFIPGSGVRSGMTKGRSMGFKDGTLRIPTDREDGMVTGRDTADAGDWEAPVDEILSWLRNHRLFGDREEGFWEVPQVAPGISSGEIAELQRAAIKLDVDELEAFVKREESGWNREELLSIARDSLAQAREMHENARKQAELELAERQAADELAAQEKAVAVAEKAAAKKAAVVEPAPAQDAE